MAIFRMNFTKNKDLEYIGLVILSLYPLYSYFLISLSIALFVILVITSAVINRRLFSFDKIKNNGKRVILYFGFYIYIIVRAFFSDDLLSDLLNFRSSIFLLIFPIIYLFSNFELTKSKLLNLQKYFVFSSAILMTIIISKALILTGCFFSFSFLDNIGRAIFEIAFFDLHPIYVSLCLLLAGYFSFNIYNNKGGVWFLLIAIFFAVSIVFIASRGAIIIMLILLVFTVFRLTQKKIHRKSIVLLLCIIGIVMLGSITNRVTKKFSNLQSSELILPDKKWPTSPQIRLGVYKCSVTLIKEKIMFGNGISIFQNKLNDCYSKYNNYIKKSYNTHNYLLFLFGSSGIFATIFFMLILLFHLYKWVMFNDYYTFGLILILFGFNMFENILSRSYGVMTYVFVVSLIVYSEKQDLDFKYN